MATTPEIREWLADNGHPELRGGRGRLTGEQRAAYDAAHPSADDYGPGTSPDDFASPDGDLPFVAADDPPPASEGEAEEPAAAAAEERPSRPRASRPRFRFGGGKKAEDKDKKPGKPKRTFKRVTVAPLVESIYADLGWTFKGVPPLRRYFYAAAPIAGAVLDPVVKDTVMDRLLLQPAARNYERMQVGLALLGTPMGLMGVLATAPEPVIVRDEQGNARPAMQPVMGPDGQPTGQVMPVMSEPTGQHIASMMLLRYGVRAMADVAGGESLKRVQARAAENAERDDAVDEFIAFLLGTQTAPSMPDDEDRAEAREAGLRLAGVAP